MKPLSLALGSSCMTRSVFTVAQTTLRVIATTDLHANLRAYDYVAARHDPSRGLTRAGGLVARLRRFEGPSVLLDNGDFLSGAPVGHARVPGLGNPVVAAMNALEFDAGCVGNHDLDWGLDALRRAVLEARFPVLSANLVRRRGACPTTDATLMPPVAMIERQVDGVPLNVGVLGLTPPQVEIWCREALDGRAVTRSIAEAASAWVPELRARGADIVVALCHGGLEPGADSACAVAEVPGVDALVAGHTHRLFPGPGHAATDMIDPEAGRVNGVPTVLPGCYGRHVGVIDLDLELRDGTWRVKGARSECHAVAQRARDGRVRARVHAAPAVLSATRDAHEAAMRDLSLVVGRIERPLHSYFAHLGYCPSAQLAANVARDHVMRAVAGTPYAAFPVVGLMAPARAGGREGPEAFVDVGTGPVTRGHVAQIDPFPNRIAAIEVDGATLIDWLERSVSALGRLMDGEQEVRMRDNRFPASELDLPAGASFAVDLAAAPRYGPGGQLLDPTARRVRDLRVGGQPLHRGMRLLLAVSDFRAGGGGTFPATGPNAMLLRSDEMLQEAIAAWIATNELPALAPAFRLHAPRPVVATLDTGLGALRHVEELDALGVVRGAAEVRARDGQVRISLDVGTDGPLETFS